jgi:hypothetical protein
MDLGILVLYLLCSIAGLIMMVGGVWLIYREKIYFDRQTKEVTTEVKLPWNVTVKTNAPALVLFFIGLAALIIPILKPPPPQPTPPKPVTITGPVETTFPVVVYAVKVGHIDIVRSSRSFQLEVPSPLGDDGRHWLVIYQCGRVFRDAPADLNTAKDGIVTLLEKDFTDKALYEKVIPVVDVPMGYPAD